MLEPILTLNIPFREPMVLYKNEFQGTGEGPIVSLVSGIHGDELNGIYLLTRLAAFLEEVVQGKKEGYTLQGTVRLVPVVNVPGVNFALRNWPFDGTDINRMFPGYDQGETTQRIADGVFQATLGSHYAFDVHSSNEQFYELPHLRTFFPDERELKLAPYLRCPYLLHRELTPLYKTQLAYLWKDSGISPYILMLGVARRIDESMVQQVFHGLIDFMVATEILAGPPLAPPPATPFFRTANTHLVLSQAAGIFRPTAVVGTEIEQEDLIGHIYNVLTGALEEEVRAPASGLLAGLRAYPMVYEKELLARIFSPHESLEKGFDIWYPEQ
ncbi:M14 family metallopeptidase [Heliorestis convoluta]|uniref:Succinylglutamate desuccinylase/aspartoacylase n=1 Tax=Heliorestis convoluta TaxID=356322 RepID=A0A5Q2MW41_9FIRM|nr:M14 family metallopeptidase [Heliorestis convoluta]QGG46477.1 Succinylglutamate desuccinylase/aspartoacylase [Heliorestis convoluta]